LRREQMYEFLDRLINIALPRVRDFRGVNGKSFDGRGNYALGLKEQLIFPEINYDKVETVRGMDIIICTTAKTDEEAKALLAGFRMPFINWAEKGSLNGEDEFCRKEQAASEDGRAVRGQAQQAEGCREEQDGDTGGALRGCPEAGRTAAQLCPDPRTQPLRTDRPPPRRLSQAETFSQH